MTTLALINEWMGIVPNASEHGEQIDIFLEFCHWFMLILFVGWSIFFFYCLWRFWRRRQPKADYYGVRGHGSTHIEIGVVIIEAVLLIGFAIPLWAARVSEFPTGGNVTRVHAIAYQFGWDFHYPGGDGIYGRKSPSLITAENPLGLDNSDPHAADDFWTKNKLTLPNETPAIVEITSKDVIHNFAVKSMRIGQDAIPGLMIPVTFTPVRTGEFEIVCAQLCGSGHYSMKGWLEVKSAADYAKFVAAQKRFGSPSQAPAAPVTPASPSP